MEAQIQEQVETATPAFTEINYKDVTEVNYLQDFRALNIQNATFLQTINYSESNSEKKERSAFDSIADDLYKKILKQGYIERPSKISKKGKKGDADLNYYNSNDVFIDDDQCCIEKKDKFSQFEDYQCIRINSLEQFYSSQLYQERVNDLIVEVNKRKSPDQFNPNDENQIQKFDEIKKKIKKSILETLLSKGPHLKTLEDHQKEPQKQEKKDDRQKNEPLPDNVINLIQ